MASSWLSLHRRSITFIPEAKEAGAVPFGAGDGEGDLGEAVIGLAVPGKTVSHHHYPLGPSVPLPDQNRAKSKLGPFLVKAGQAGGHCRSSFFCNPSAQHSSRCVVLGGAAGSQ